MRPIEEGEFNILLEGEDAPQIAGIVDERGPVDFTDKRRWKIITENDEGDLTIINHIIDKDKRNLDEANTKQANDNSDLSPPRAKHSKNKHVDLSPHGQSKGDSSDLNLSPPGQSKNYNSDLSPSRQSRNNDSDLSPPRKLKNYDSDLSPPRNTKHRTSAHSTSGRSYRSSGNKDSDSDFSPPRKNRKQNLDTDLYESRKKTKGKDSDSSTSRRNDHRSRRDNSSHSISRRNNREHDYYDKKNLSRYGRQDVSRSNRDKEEKKYEDRDHKSRSYSDIREKRKKTRWDEETNVSERGHARNYSRDHHDRATKTLDGKTAGFQAAIALREETEAHKRQEAEHFSKLNKEITGEGQATIVRDKTGRKRNLEAEAAEKQEQEMKQREIDEKYAKWGKGLKQVEDREEKLKNDLYEMHKPLARYADDADLDKELREQDREGDPMLKYIKQKQIKEGKRKPDPPQYQGSYAPNRFGIKPGHRWDGVDRSNGYEKKWYEAQNAKVALQEDAYKWSTADM
ncbi:BUD13 protein, partial [Acromyrmex heyeri]